MPRGSAHIGWFPVPSSRYFMYAFCRNCTTPYSFSHTRHGRFCSLSWYDRQLVENSRTGDDNEGSPKDGEEEEEGGQEALGEGDAGAAGTTSLSSSPRPHGSDAGVGVGFGARARPAEASVMATLKASGEMVDKLTSFDRSKQGSRCCCRPWGRAVPRLCHYCCCIDVRSD